MPVIKCLKEYPTPPKNVEHNFLWRHRANVNSQSGEDGVIAEIFRLIGTTNKWCVEFGAWDGVHLSNTRRLVLDEGWSAVMIEAENHRCAKIKENYPEGNVIAICGFAWLHQRHGHTGRLSPSDTNFQRLRSRQHRRRWDGIGTCGTRSWIIGLAWC